MLKSLNNDSKIKMRLNIKRHRQKLLQYLENVNDTVLKPRIELVSNDLVKSKLPLSTEVHPTKLKPTHGDAKIKTRTSIQQQNKSLRNSEVKTPKHESDVEINQEPIIFGEINYPETRSTMKPLKDLLIEELNNSSSSEELDDNISVGNNEDWNEINQPDNSVDKYNKHDSIAIDAVKHCDSKSKECYLYYSSGSDIPESEQNHYINTRKNKRTKKKGNLAKPLPEKPSRKKQRFRELQERTLHNAKERATRNLLSKQFCTLRKLCNFLDSNRREPSKYSILMAAKKECDFLRRNEKKMIAEKKTWHKANKDLKSRLASLVT